MFTADQRADVEFGNRPRPDHSVGLQGMIGLKTLYGVDQRAVISITRCADGMGQVALAVQALGQFRHALVFHRRAQQRAVAQVELVVAEGGGVKIDVVESNSAAAQIGLLADDVIIGVNRQRIANLAELRKMLENRDGVAALNIRRGNTNLYVLIR